MAFLLRAGLGRHNPVLRSVILFNHFAALGFQAEPFKHLLSTYCALDFSGVLVNLF